MAKTFSDAPHYAGQISSEYLLGIQIGNTPSADGGLEQMMYVKASELRAFMREGMASVYNYRGEYSSLPTDLAVGDTFYAASSFSEGGNTYLAGHLYAYNGTSWDDITNILTQYAQQAEVDSINERLTEAEGKIDALSGFIFKGDATRATLPTASASNQGWVYYLTDESIYVASDGTQWVTVMNYVVQTITEGDTTHAPSSDAVYKALAQRDAKDADLQSQIVNTNAELDNVEALIGGDAQVENTDPTEGESLLAQSRLIHHANLLPNGEFGRVGARSVAWNQLAKFDAEYIPSDSAGVSYIYTDGTSFKLNGTATANATRQGWFGLDSQDELKGRGGHRVVFFSVLKRGSVSNGTIMFYINSNSGSLGQTFVATLGNDLATNRLNMTVPNGTVCNNAEICFICCDLTVMGLDSLTANQFRALFPASYYPYNEGHIYDLNPSGFGIRGINLWDEEWEVGTISESTGVDVVATDRIRSKNYIPIRNWGAYFFKSPINGVGFWYDIDKNYLGSVSISPNASITAPSIAYYFRFCMALDYGNTYNHDIQICDNSLPDAVKTTMHPYEEHTVETPQIADGHYVNENCYDYVENVVEDGVLKGKKHTVGGSIVFDGSDDEIWSRFSDTGINQFYISVENVKSSAGGQVRTLCDKYRSISSDNRQNSFNTCYSGTNWIGFNIENVDYSQFKALLQANPITVYYELSNETITDCEPLRSFPISDYSTVEPITPQTELVNRIDVPFSVKSVSANTLIEQITQNTADIAEEKVTRTAQVSALEKRVTNLELKTGDQFDVDYPSDTYGMNGVPANVEPYARVKEARGVSRVRNNLGKAINSTNWIPYSTTYSSTSFADGEVTISWKADVSGSENFRYGIRQNVYYNVYANHLYLVSYEIFSSKDLRYVDESLVGSYIGSTPAPLCEANKWTKIAYVVSAPYDNSTRSSLIYPNYNQSFVEGDYYKVRNYILTDLSVYFGTLDLSWIGSTYAERIATIQQKYPWLLVPSDYGTSMVDSEVSGVRAYSRNLFDGVWEDGYLNPSNGSIIYSSGYKTTDYIPIKPLTEFYIKGTQTTTDSVNVAYYGQNKEFIYHVGSVLTGLNRTFTTQSGVYYMRITITNASTKTEGFMLNQSDSLNGTYTPYFTDNLAIPNPIPLRSARSVADTDELNVEVDVEVDGVQKKVNKRRQTQKISSYVFDGVTDVTSSSAEWMINCYAFRISVTKTLELDAVASANTLSSKYIFDLHPNNTVGTYTLYRDANGLVVYINQDNNAMGMTAFKALLQSNPITFYFARETPIITLSDPVEDPYIKVEPNGTVRTVQSQSPEVDSAMTVKYMVA